MHVTEQGKGAVRKYPEWPQRKRLAINSQTFRKIEKRRDRQGGRRWRREKQGKGVSVECSAKVTGGDAMGADQPSTLGGRKAVAMQWDELGKGGRLCVWSEEEGGVDNIVLELYVKRSLKMKLRRTGGSSQGSSVRGECARGEHSEAVGKRKRRMSKEKVVSGNDEVSEFREGMYGGRQADKDGKGKGNREGKRLKQEVEYGKGRHGKGGKG
ncbi:hypothetical protein Cgig2_026635 [Carnegiea gigantea]|uniref:Uncharacterized protein n=1 Tax=Carnegiea gigantea TaxID=171969 RepID=A0A9Q1K477_9CARY|nr:hypothetical protein Cgig2_026635 [Carnegiea gigantea]